MPSLNDNNPIKNIFCIHGCGTRLTFDDKIVSINGKKIPLNFSDREPHECPKRNDYKKNYAERPSSNHNNQKNQNIGRDSYDLASNRNSFLNRISDFIEYNNKQQEQIVINQNQIKNQQKELMQFLMELVRK